MASTIKIKNSSTSGAVPGTGDLVQGELAINVTDRSIYTENASGTVVKLNAPSIDDKNTGATKHVTIDTSGNLGLGVTPSAWNSAAKAIEFSGGQSIVGYNGLALISTSNTYLDSGGTYRYKTTAAASLHYNQQGVYTWYNAASGTAGNTISFTQAMTLDASGNLGVGTTSPSTYGKIVAYGGDVVSTNGTITGFMSYSTSVVSGTAIGTSSNHALKFYTNGANVGLFDTSGNLLVGLTSGIVGGARISVQSAGSVSIETNATSTYYPMWFQSSGVQKGYIQTTSSATTYNTTSDYRLKENIAPMTGALSVVAALKPCTYTWKADGSEGQGFIAHELAEVVPECVSGEKDGTFEDGTPLYQGIDTSFLVATLTAAIKEQQAIIAQQSLAIESLTARITALEA